MDLAAEELLPDGVLEGTNGIVYSLKSSSPSLADSFSASIDLASLTPPSNIKNVVGMRSMRKISFKSNCNEADVGL